MKFRFKIQQYQTEAVEQTVNVFAEALDKADEVSVYVSH